MSIYTYIPDSGDDDQRLILTERNIYGSSRLGVEQVNQVVAAFDVGYIDIHDENGIYNGIENRFTQKVGDKRYELSNHLGNVLQVVTDRKLAVDQGVYDTETATYSTTTPDGLVDYYIADVVSQSDYYPFGMLMPNTDPLESEIYTYLFNGKEHDPETYGNGNVYDYGFRIYNPRLGKFLSMDPLVSEYPFYTPYQFAGNKPIWATDIDGLEEWIYTYEWNAKTQTATLLKKEHNIKVQQRMRKSYEGGAPRADIINLTTGEKMRPMEAGTTTSELGTVQYRYVDKDGNQIDMRKNYNGDYVEGSNEIMPMGQNNSFGSIYVGPTNPTAIVDGKEIPDYRREPLDELDMAAYNHDKAYDLVGAIGADGAFNDPATIKADKKLLHDAKIIKEGYMLNQKDEVTGKQITYSQYRSASKVVLLFEFIVWRKEGIIEDREYNPGGGYQDDGYEKQDNTFVVKPIVK